MPRNILLKDFVKALNEKLFFVEFFIDVGFRIFRTVKVKQQHAPDNSINAISL